MTKTLKESLEQSALAVIKTFIDSDPNSIESNVKSLAKLPNFSGINDQEIEEVILKIKKIQGINMDPASLINDESDDFEKWLNDERKECLNEGYWRNYKRLLSTETNYSSNVITSLDIDTDRIVSQCSDPLISRKVDRRGMVVGSVQSGKTSNYIGLITKAADYGYKVIIIIAGIHENLRSQTQKRVNEGFIGFDSSKKEKLGVGTYDTEIPTPFSFTTETSDFDVSAANRFQVRLESNLGRPVVFVIKKNTYNLKNFSSWVKSSKGYSENIDLPLLVIDDEADNASPNTRANKDEVSKINSQIREVLTLFKVSTYVGYTATPFANIFIDPDTDDEMLGNDLFPKDFIVGLEPPSNYFGPTRIFVEERSNESNILQPIIDNEDYLPVKHKKDSNLSIPPSLEDAVRSFFIVNSIKSLRGIHDNKDSSMLVNVSIYTQVQEDIKLQLYQFVEDIKNAIRTFCALDSISQDDQINALQRVFEKLFIHTGFNWTQVKPSLIKVYKRIKVVSINGQSVDPLDYKSSDENKEPISVIAVGGYSLSRGLTLEGLIVSYFLRSSAQYDTLLQMGRWFGYRDGYDDLCKIWMTYSVIDWYSYITESVNELRDKLRQMQRLGLTPSEFGLEVRSHPNTLRITARNKIGTGKEVVRRISLSERFIETTEIPYDLEILQTNFSLFSEFINNLKTLQTLNSDNNNGNHGFLIKNINVSLVESLLAKFKSSSSLTYPINPVLDYIEKRSDSELKNWDVFIPSIIGNSRYGKRKIEISGIPITTQTRAFIETDDGRLKLSNRGKVSGRYIEKVGISPDQVEKTIASWRMENPLKSKDAYPDSIFRIKNRSPLLVIHFIDLFKEIGSPREFSNKDQFSITAWSLSFPPSTIRQEKVEYLVNKTWTRQKNLFEEEIEEV